MKYSIKYGKVVEKFLRKHTVIAPKVMAKLDILAENPYQNNLDIVKLDGYEHIIAYAWENIAYFMRLLTRKY